MCRPSDRDVNWISPVQEKSSIVQIKEPYSIYLSIFQYVLTPEGLLVGFHPASRSVTPADNTHEGVKRKKE